MINSLGLIGSRAVRASYMSCGEIVMLSRMLLLGGESNAVFKVDEESLVKTEKKYSLNKFA